MRPDDQKAGDGLFWAASGTPSIPSWLGGAVFDQVYLPKAENEKYARRLRTSAGAAVFIGATEGHASWIAVGRSCQRFALQATALGMVSSFVNHAIDVAALRPALAALVGVPGRRPDLVMRFGYGAALPYSLRRPVEKVIEG